MPIYDSNRLFDGYSNLANGVDGGRLPNLIDQNQCEESQNAIFRGGGPGTRPAILDVALTYENDISYDGNGNLNGPVAAPDDPDNSQSVFQTGLFQGAEYFSHMGVGYIMASVNGRLYRFRPAKAKQEASVYEVPLDRRNRRTITQAFMVQAGAYFIVQDGEARPIIFDGSVGIRAGSDQIFTGRFMAVGQGRIVLVGIDDLIYFGDIRDGKGRGDLDMLDFTETRFLNEGGSTALPPECGKPTGIAFLPQQDAATGVGDCIVFGESGAEGFTLSIPRETWKDSQFQRPVLREIGLCGPWAVTTVNNDLIFRSPLDGWRTYRQARAEADKLSQVPISTNVRKWLKAETKSLLNFTSVASFDNRVVMTTTPMVNQGRYYNNSLLSLDFDVLSTFGNSSQPAWDGNWTHRTLDPMTGLKVMKLVSGVFDGEKRLFAFCQNTAGLNYLREIELEPSRKDTGGSITSRIVTRSLEFDTPMDEKTLYGADVFVDQVQEHIDGSLRFRPDQAPLFVDWADFTAEPFTDFEEGEALVDKPGILPRIPIPMPGEDADPYTGRLYRRGFEFQVEVSWTGRGAIRKLRAHAQRETEQSGPSK